MQPIASHHWWSNFHHDNIGSSHCTYVVYIYSQLDREYDCVMSYPILSMFDFEKARTLCPCIWESYFEHWNTILQLEWTKKLSSNLCSTTNIYDDVSVADAGFVILWCMHESCSSHGVCVSATVLAAIHMYMYLCLSVIELTATSSFVRWKSGAVRLFVTVLTHALCGFRWKHFIQKFWGHLWTTSASYASSQTWWTNETVMASFQEG